MRIDLVLKQLVKPKLLFLPRPHKLLFEHIPKCGGTAVKHFLISQYFNRRIFLINGRNPSKSISHFQALPEKRRYYYDLIVGHGAHKLRQYSHPETLKATIFRDPIDRIVSHYFYVLRSPEHYLHKQVTDRRISLVDYATSNLSQELRNNYVTRFLQISADEAEKNAEDSINRAYNLLREEYAVVGFLEELQDVMDTLTQSLNFHNQFKPKKLNVTGDRPKLADLDRDVLRTIEEANFLDVELYKLIKENVSDN